MKHGKVKLISLLAAILMMIQCTCTAGIFAEAEGTPNANGETAVGGSEEEPVYTAPTAALSSGSAEAGEKVTLDLKLHNNPGFCGLTIALDYDRSILEFSSAEKMTTAGQLNASVQEASFVFSQIGGDYSDNGDFIRLTFKILSEAPEGDTTVSFRYSEGDIINWDEENVLIDMLPGTVTVKRTVKWWSLEDGVLSVFRIGDMPAFEIGEQPWYDKADEIRKVIISDSVTAISNDIFTGCEGLTSVSIPKSVTSIGRSAFLGCTALESFDLSGISVIEDETFKGCTALRTLVFASGLTKIGESAFEGCTSLEDVILPEGLSYIAYRAFRGCTSIKEITYPQSLTDTGWEVFDGCISLEKAVLPDAMKTLPGATFNGCYALKSISFPAQMTAIGSGAMSGCSSLVSLSLPAGVNSIGRNVFNGCSSLTSIYFFGNTPGIPDASVFAGTPETLVLYSMKGTFGWKYPTWNGVKSEIHEHAFSFDAESHWTDCVCGLKIPAEKHCGGVATCISPAVCEKCGQMYGEPDLSSHKLMEVNDDGKVFYICVDCNKKFYDSEGKTDHIPGDVNGDEKVNGQDLTFLLRFIAGDNLECAVTDVNGDGITNCKDLARLMRYLAGESVELF